MTYAVIHFNVPSDCLRLIYKFFVAEEYESFTSFRTPKDYAKNIWPVYRATAQAANMFSHQKNPIIPRALTSLGVHPLTILSSQTVDLSNNSEVDALAREVSEHAQRRNQLTHLNSQLTNTTLTRRSSSASCFASRRIGKTCALRTIPPPILR